MTEIEYLERIASLRKEIARKSKLIKLLVRALPLSTVREIELFMRGQDE